MNLRLPSSAWPRIFVRSLLYCVASIFLSSVLAVASELNSYDWNNITSKEIEEFKAQRKLFFEAHTAGRAEAIQEYEAQSDRVDGNQADYDVRFYGIHLSLNFAGESVSGYVDYRLESLVASLDQVDLNLRSELIVDSIVVAGTATTFSHVNHLISTNLPSNYNNGETVEMQVYYHGVPHYDGAAGLDFTSEFGTNLAWTKATPYRSRYWWPCKDYPVDKPDSIDLFMEFPLQYDIATNGIQLSVTNLGNGRKIEHWRHRYPISTYNVAFCVAQYDKVVQDWTYESDTIPFYTYSLPNHTSAMSAFQVFGPPALTVLSDRYGPYPFMTEKMGHADFGWSGAMEHQTFCMYSTNFHTEWVIAHETGHQWWGDMITCATFNHIWINEGFASYSEALYFEQTQGNTAYHNYMESLEYFGPGSIYVENLVYEEIYNGSLSYDKSAWVLHMLRGVLGDSLFFQSIRDFANSQYRFGGATTDNFADVVSTFIGEDISWFTDEWIYGEGHPEYQFGWECENVGGGYELSLFIEQVQGFPTTFTMPVKTTFQTTGGNIDTTIWNDDDFVFYSLNFADSVTGIILDPDKWILRTVEEVPFGMKIATRSLPEAPEGEFYSQTLGAVGGDAPYTWTFFGGDLPFGMTFDAPTATISGTPTFKATYYFTITCHDASEPPLADTINYSITVVDPSGLCGDSDDNGEVTITDAVYIINFIFGGGPPPADPATADADCNGQVTITDAVYIINFIFGGGQAPCAACP